MPSAQEFTQAESIATNCEPKEQKSGVSGRSLVEINADLTESNRQLREELERVKEREVRPRVHGNGFIQLDLSRNKRLHIFGDPIIPRQVVETPIHDHTFNFVSRIISGRLINIWYDLVDDPQGTHFVYQARVRDREDTVLENTGRRVKLVERDQKTLVAGETYSMAAGDFHETWTVERTVTIITKDKPSLAQGGASPRVLCAADKKPDNDFNRYAEDEAVLWDIITAGSHVKQLAESNRQISAELEMTQFSLNVADEQLEDREQRIAVFTTALAAAKEALEANQRWLIKHTDIEGDVPLLEKYVNPVLALIAECEKE
jgi:hypothetical protein